MRFSVVSAVAVLASIAEARLEFVAVPKVIGVDQDYNVTLQTSIGQGSWFQYSVVMGLAYPDIYDDKRTFGSPDIQINALDAPLGKSTYTTRAGADKGQDVRIRAAIFGGFGVANYPEVTIVEANVTIGDANSDELAELKPIYKWNSYYGVEEN